MKKKSSFLWHLKFFEKVRGKSNTKVNLKYQHATCIKYDSHRKKKWEVEILQRKSFRIQMNKKEESDAEEERNFLPSLTRTRRQKFSEQVKWGSKFKKRKNFTSFISASYCSCSWNIMLLWWGWTLMERCFVSTRNEKKRSGKEKFNIMFRSTQNAIFLFFHVLPRWRLYTLTQKTV